MSDGVDGGWILGLGLIGLNLFVIIFMVVNFGFLFVLMIDICSEFFVDNFFFSLLVLFGGRFMVLGFVF